MASLQDTASFFLHGDSKQFDHVLKLYPQALKLKADTKAKKPEELIKLDNWYQNELPKKIKSRGKDAHLVHEELVQLMKWKQTRGKYYPQLSYLVKVNTPRAVMAETKKAFKKMPNIESAITALSNLKGVGTTLASALLAAANPESAPFMADECLRAMPDMESIDYTAKEYLNFVSHIRNTCERLNKETNGLETKWNPHSVELAVWAHCVVSELQPSLLDGGPASNGSSQATPTLPPQPALETSDESNLEPPPFTNGKLAAESLDDATTSCTEDSLDKAASPIPPSNIRSASVEVDVSSEENSTESTGGAGEEVEPPPSPPSPAPQQEEEGPPAKKSKAAV